MNNNLKKEFLLLLEMALLLTACVGENKETVPSGLRCEYQENPIGLDMLSPRFTWTFDSDESNFAQKSYQLQVAITPEALCEGKPDVWTSGKVNSPATLALYAGSTLLKSHGTYYWTVSVWDSYRKRCSDFSVASF